MRIKKWILNGNLDPSNTTPEEVLAQCGDLMEGACTAEILDEIIFEGDDGKYYTITLEAVLSEANPEYVKGRLEDLKEMED